MNYYFVDYENVGSEGLNGIGSLDENSSVLIFYSRNADKITFDIHMQINESKASVTYCNVETKHKNALDFQLSSYMGYVIHENTGKESEYFIVSKDNGFNALVSFWEKYNVSISIIKSINHDTHEAEPESGHEPNPESESESEPEPKPAQQPKPEPKPASQPKPATRPAKTTPQSEPTSKEIRAKISGYFTDKAILTEVVRIIRTYKTKQGINNALVKKYESQKAGEIYKIIKPHIAYKKGS